MIDDTLIIDMCSGCPRFLIKCPGMTEGDRKKNGTRRCKTMMIVIVDGTKHMCPRKGSEGVLAANRAMGYIVEIIDE